MPASASPPPVRQSEPVEPAADGTPAAAPAGRDAASTVARAVRHTFAHYGLVVLFAAVIVLFTALNPDVFPTLGTAQAVAATQAVVAMLALAAMLPLVAGQFDLSLGFQLGFGQALCSGLIVKSGMPAGLAAGCALASCTVFGLVNGLIVTRLAVNALIATLGTGIVIQGMTQWYTGGNRIFGTMPASFLALGQDQLGPVPLPFVYVLVATAVLWVVVEYTVWGREVAATGGNREAARLAGVRVDRRATQAFVGGGFLAGVAAVLSVTVLGSSSPDVGLSFLLPAFAAAFLGATAIRPGRFNAVGTTLAVYLLATGITGLQQLGAAFYIEQFFNGGALLLAVVLSVLAARR
jgi:ribose transport system permease protein